MFTARRVLRGIALQRRARGAHNTAAWTSWDNFASTTDSSHMSSGGSVGERGGGY
jgi:hypothetical protein